MDLLKCENIYRNTIYKAKSQCNSNKLESQSTFFLQHNLNSRRQTFWSDAFETILVDHCYFSISSLSNCVIFGTCHRFMTTSCVFLKHAHSNKVPKGDILNRHNTGSSVEFQPQDFVCSGDSLISVTWLNKQTNGCGQKTCN